MATAQLLFGRIRIGVVGHDPSFFGTPANAGLIGEIGAGATVVVGAAVVVGGAAVHVRTTLPSLGLTPFSDKTAVADGAA